MEALAQPLNDHTQYFFDAAVEQGDMSAFTAAVLSLRGDREIVHALAEGAMVDCTPEEVVEAKHASGQAADRMTAYAADVMKHFKDDELRQLRAYAIPQTLYDCKNTAEVLAGWNYGDATTGGCLRPWNERYRVGRQLIVPSKTLLRRLESPKAIRRYVKKETPDTLARLRRINKTLCMDPFPTDLKSGLEVGKQLFSLRRLWALLTSRYANTTTTPITMSTSTANYTLLSNTTTATTATTNTVYVNFAGTLSNDEDIRFIYEQLREQIRTYRTTLYEPGVAEQWLQEERREDVIDRDVARKSLELAENVVGTETVRKFLRGEAVDIRGRNVIFRLTKTGAVDRMGHGTVTTTLYDFDGNRLCGLCVYFQDMPPLDQLAAFALYVESGEEAAILDKGNKYSLTDRGSVFFGIQKNVTPREEADQIALFNERVHGIPAARRDFRAEHERLQRAYERRTMPIYVDITRQAAFGTFTRRVRDIVAPNVWACTEIEGEEVFDDWDQYVADQYARAA